MQKEEVILFPICRQMERATSSQRFHCGSGRNPIAVMICEHDDAGDAMKRMRRLTNDYTPPLDAWQHLPSAVRFAARAGTAHAPARAQGEQHPLPQGALELEQKLGA